jgi:hypothetical protein
MAVGLDQLLMLLIWTLDQAELFQLKTLNMKHLYHNILI